MDRTTDYPDNSSFRERFGNLICSFQPQIFYVFVIESILLVLSLFSLLYVRPNTSSYTILQVDLILLGVTLPFFGLILYTCSRRT